MEGLHHERGPEGRADATRLGVAGDGWGYRGPPGRGIDGLHHERGSEGRADAPRLGRAALNPATGCPVASMAFTTNGAPRGAPTRPVWASPETGVSTTTDGVVDSLPQARAMATAARENRFIVASPGSPVSCRKTSGRVRGAAPPPA